MSKKIFWLVIVAVLAVAFYMGNPPPKHKSAAGLPDPTQIPATGEVNMKLEEYDVNIKYKASYKIKALAVSTKNYSGTIYGGENSDKWTEYFSWFSRFDMEGGRRIACGLLRRAGCRRRG